MSMPISVVRKIFKNTKSMGDYYNPKKKNGGPRVVYRDYELPKSPPSLQAGVRRFDFRRKPRPASDIRAAYGIRGNLTGSEVVTAIKNALGTGNWEFHVSDASYTKYSIWELKEFMENFDNTNLRTWIADTFDCDDFAQVLQGNVNCFFPGIALGTIWYGPKSPPWWGHAVNIFYSWSDKKVYLIEPQSNAFYAFNKTKWAPWMVII